MILSPHDFTISKSLYPKFIFKHNGMCFFLFAEIIVSIQNFIFYFFDRWKFDLKTKESVSEYEVSQHQSQL